MESVYFWKDEIHKDSEALLLIKTENEFEKQVSDYVRKIHSYEEPAVFSIGMMALL